MELWELISLLCKRVMDDQNVCLNIYINQDGWQFQLMPIGEWEDEEDD